jgi:ribosomal protein S27AE
MKNRQCSKCGSPEIMANVEVRDQEHLGAVPLKVFVAEPEPPNRGFFWIQRTSAGGLRAWICAACGFTELYTDNLHAVYEIYRKGR